MSAICGLFNTDGRPVDREALARMVQAARYRGPDGIDTWCDQNVGLVQLLMATTPEAAAESKPMFHGPSQTCIVFDGRLDNRDELSRQLQFQQGEAAGKSDMELVLHAWLLWGKESPAHLLGDFAFAVFDIRARQLFCARDIFSVKPLYYSWISGQFTFGSTIGQVLANPAVPRRANEGMIAEYLASQYLSPSETIYSGVNRLPGCHSLTVGENQLKVTRYWQVPFKNQIRYSQPESYVEQFEEIFTESVRCRLRSSGSVGATLSGGKDSPLVAAMAQSLLRRSGSTTPLKSFSITYPGRECDESALIKDVVSKWKLDASYYPTLPHAPEPDWEGQIKKTLDFPETPPASALARAQIASVANGTRVWLSGAGAGGLFSGGDFVSAALLREGKIGKFVREMRHQVGSSGSKFAALHLAAGLFWPVLSSTLRGRLQAARHQLVHAHFATEEFCRAAGLESRHRTSLNASEFDELSHWSQYTNSFLGFRPSTNEAYDLWNGFYGIEERHPFLDLRLAEFAFSVPGYVHKHCDKEKLLLLALGEKLLPDSVLRNRLSPEAGRLFLDVMCRGSVREIFVTLECADRGWVLQKEALEVYDSLARTYQTNPNALLQDYVYRDYTRLLALWAVLSVELWLRHVRI